MPSPTRHGSAAGEQPLPGLLTRIAGTASTGPFVTHDGRIAWVSGQTLHLSEPEGGHRGERELGATWLTVASAASRMAFVDAEGRCLACALDGSSPVELVVPGGDDRARPVALSDDGARALVCAGGQRLLLDARTGALLAEAPGYADRAAFSPDGARLAIAPSFKPPELLDAADLRVHRVAAPKVKQSATPGFSPSGRRVAFSGGRSVLVVDAEGRRLESQWKCTRDVVSLVFLTEDTLAFATRATIELRRAADGAEVARLAVPSTELAVDAARRWLVSGVHPVWVKPSSPVAELFLFDVARLLEQHRAPAAPEAGGEDHAGAAGPAGAIPVPSGGGTRRKAKRRPEAPAPGCLFAVPATVPTERLVAAAKNLHHILDRQPDDFALVMLADEGTRGLRWFWFVGSRGRHYLLDPWVETLCLDLGELTVALRDRAGRSRYERYRTGELAPARVLVGDGTGVRATVGTGPVGARGGDAIAVGLGADHPEEAPPSGPRVEGAVAIVLMERGHRVERRSDVAGLSRLTQLLDLEAAALRPPSG